MKKTVLATAFLAGLTATQALAEDPLGRAEYMTACAGCHGESGKGDCPLAGLLNIQTPSLTTITGTKGDGEFPMEWVIWMIDGRNIIRAHGAEMPVWGDRYLASAEVSEAESETPESEELVVRGRILSLAYYLESIQE